jgi:hypothetical protein
MKYLKKTVPVVSALIGLVAGCIIAYFALALFWTHVIVRPENVTARDSWIVYSLSLIIGVITGISMLVVSAQRCWVPQGRSLHRNVT